MTRALITGISGFVGSHLAEYLLANTDWDIDGLIRWRSPLDNLAGVMQLANEGKRVRFLYADLRDTLSVFDAVNKSEPDYVFHLAAQSFPGTSFAAPLDTIDTNTQGTVRLLEALRQHSPAALIHVCSSSEVYGRVPKAELPIREDSPFHPASPYAISKIGADMVAQHYAEAYGMHIQITRMFTHTGPRRGDVFAESSFAKQLAMIEVGMLPAVVMVGNTESMRTVADVRDAVRAYHMLLTVDPKPGAIYNIGGAHSCTIMEILKTLTDMTTGGAHIRYRVDPARLRPIDADNQIPDCSKFKGVTAWEPTIPFEKTMRDLLQYWRGRVQRETPLQR
jgi:GDP-4-dehydro-6-deoxy-D-mannose reductase